MCISVEDTCLFKSKHLDGVHKSKKYHNCNSKICVYLIQSQVCAEQYTDSTKNNFLSRAKNYESTHQKFKSKNEVPKQALKQRCLPQHYYTENHKGIADKLNELKIKRAVTYINLKLMPNMVLTKEVYEQF